MPEALNLPRRWRCCSCTCTYLIAWSTLRRSYPHSVRQRAGDQTSDDYVRALHALITTVVDTAAMAPPPTQALWQGLKKSAGSDKVDMHFTSLIRWLAFKRATGTRSCCKCSTATFPAHRQRRIPHRLAHSLHARTHTRARRRSTPVAGALSALRVCRRGRAHVEEDPAPDSSAATGRAGSQRGRGLRRHAHRAARRHRGLARGRLPDDLG